MPKLKHRPPSYRLHKCSGQAIVTLNGRDHYLGVYGSPESHAAYQRLVGEWLVTKPAPLPNVSTASETTRADLRINELLVAYLEFAAGYYVKNGRPTGELANMKDAMKPLQELYETTPVALFGPTALKTVRDVMVQRGLSRKVVNARVNRIRRVFKWGVENQLVEPSVLHALQAVAPLKRGRSEARETSRVTPVAQVHIDAVLAHVTRPVRAMIELQLVTGMRPGEVVLMRTCDLDMSGRIWQYRPVSHKTEHHGIERIIFLGPRAQAIVRPLLSSELGAYLFRPKDALRDIQQRRAENARVRRRPHRLKRRANPRKQPGEHYTSASYCYAIHKACRAAGVPVWGPNRLRHNAATFLRKEFGLEAARVILGHTSAAVTEVYAEMDRKKAAEIMGVVG